jgi:hypothetical protein
LDVSLRKTDADAPGTRQNAAMQSAEAFVARSVVRIVAARRRQTCASRSEARGARIEWSDDGTVDAITTRRREGRKEKDEGMRRKNNGSDR